MPEVYNANAHSPAAGRLTRVLWSRLVAVCVWFGLVWFGLVRGNGHTVARRFGLDVAQKIFRLVQLGRNRAAEPNASENEHVVCPFLRRREQDRRVRSRMSEWKWLHWSESHDPWNVGHGSFLAAGDPPVPPNSRSAQCDFGASQRIQRRVRAPFT
jgi:hypothetical protein